MTSLPEFVEEDELKAMFSCADKDGNGRINYKEFTVMCNVPKQESIPNTLPDVTTKSRYFVVANLKVESSIKPYFFRALVEKQS